jgi:ribulose 1,5-bisphosphate carboxylase large subunit-like protein
MELTKEYLLNLKAQATEQRQKHWDMVQQANGAIAMVDVLLTELDREEPENQDGKSTV